MQQRLKKPTAPGKSNVTLATTPQVMTSPAQTPAWAGGQRKLTSSPAPTVQRDDDKGKAKEESPFKFNIQLLPPELKLKLYGLMLKADTGQTELNFTHNLIQYQLGYSYGSDLFLDAKKDDMNLRLGYNPSKTSLSVGMGADQFRTTTSVNLKNGGFGLGVSYGAPLLPMPDMALDPRTQQVQKGGAALPPAVAGLRSDPVTYIQEQGGNASDVMKAVKTVKPWSSDQNFGVGLDFLYDPKTGIMINGALQWTF